jgi:hypothetical protein
MEEQSALLKTISHQLDNLNRAIPELQAKVSKAKLDHFAAINAIQVRIDENVRM